MKDLLENVTLFANPNGKNAYTLDFLRLLARLPHSNLSVVSLSESLPDYARFPSKQRKARLEEVLLEAARTAATQMTDEAKALGLKCAEPRVLSGRFPQALLSDIDSTSTTLLVKESLPCDGEFGNASKGDLKLSRHSSAPVLLAHAPIREGNPVVVGIAPDVEDASHDRLCIELVETAKQLADVLGSTLCVVHAWDLWGEGLLRSRISHAELEEALSESLKSAQAALERVIEKSNVNGDDLEFVLGKGDPTNVLSKAIDEFRPGLVVLGSNAREGLQGAVLGNTAEVIARSKQASVLILR